MKGDVLLNPVKVRGFTPLTARKNKIERKKQIRDIIKEKIGKDIIKVRKLCKEKPVFVDVCFYLLKTDDISRSKKDLDNLMKIVCDSLLTHMIQNNKEEELKGLDLINDDSEIYETRCRKKLVETVDKEGFDLMISLSSER